MVNKTGKTGLSHEGLVQEKELPLLVKPDVVSQVTVIRV